MRIVKTYSLVFLVLTVITAHRLLAQAIADQKLATAFALERDGRTAQAIADVHALLGARPRIEG